MKIRFYENVEDSLLKFAVIISKSNGKWVFCKHSERETYEIPGGHREPGESILETARRELREETGAIEFDIKPVCVYSVTGKNRVNMTGEETFGMLFLAEIYSFEKELHSEMEKIELMDEQPEAMTYPLIQPFLMKEFLRRENLKAVWMNEEETAYIKGWDFSHIHGKYEEGNDLPWSYEEIIKQYLKDDFMVLDYDTGGGEFLLSLNHPYDKTAATEGYPPNVELCKKRLLSLGIDFKECNNPSEIPYEDEVFDMILNRHGDFQAKELYRLLKKDGLFITQQVGCENDRDLVELVLPGIPKPFPHANMEEQKKLLEEAGFQIIRAEEVYRPIRFYDIGAFVWFARIIEWEFPGFSVEKCFDKLLKMQEKLERDGVIEGTTHRYLLAARK